MSNSSKVTLHRISKTSSPTQCFNPRPRVSATHFLFKTLPKVATEMALCVLGYNLTRVMNIVGVKALKQAITT